MASLLEDIDLSHRHQSGTNLMVIS
jgi:hypothetical protein